jgi:transcriptional regulator with XRE-family HTH domain
MPETSGETLAQYVNRILKEKGLTPQEVKELSGGKITDGYVRGIMTGKARNPSVLKLKALARGLDVDEDELFNVARGLTMQARPRGYESKYRVIASVMFASLKNPTLAELLFEVAGLSPETQGEVVRTLKYLNSRKQRGSRSKKSG